MKTQLTILGVALALTGCTAGTQVTGRDVNLSEPFPTLHSVPDCPPAPDYVEIELERESFEEGHESMLELNQEIRGKYKAPEKE